MSERRARRLGLVLVLVATVLLGVVAIAAFGGLLRTPNPDPTPSVLPSASEVPAVDDGSSWRATGAMVTDRTSGHTVTLLHDGRVLVAGLSIAELLDPNDLSWSSTGTMVESRSWHSATLLADGRVLVAGGGISDATASAELYDPVTGTWTATGQMAHARWDHTATLLLDGRVLVVGGPSAELYDPTTGTWSETGNPIEVGGGTATLLADGRVLVVGGAAELYDPDTGTWTATGGPDNGRGGHTATLLVDGRVLIAGGTGGGIGRATAEVFDPDTGTWTVTGFMNEPRNGFTATLLLDGRVLAAGGGVETTDPRYPNMYIDSGEGRDSAEIYDPITGSWTLTRSMLSPHGWHEATRLSDGRVLIVSGYGKIVSLYGTYVAEHPGAEVYAAAPEPAGVLEVGV